MIDNQVLRRAACDVFAKIFTDEGERKIDPCGNTRGRPDLAALHEYPIRLNPFLWNTTGIANVRELQLIHEAGLSPLEAIRSATYNSAQTLRRPDLGLVQTGFTADLLIVDGNPLKNLRFLYAFGALDSAEGKVVRRGGIRFTIKGGVVFDNAVLIDEVLEMVRKSREDWTNPVPGLFEPVIGESGRP